MESANTFYVSCSIGHVGLSPRPVTCSHRFDKYYTDSSHVELIPVSTSSTQGPVSLNTLYALLTITLVTGQA